MNLHRPRPNTDKMMYPNNRERANVCVFCCESFTNIVNHYKKKHSGEEVYVSRIAPKMAHRLRGDYFSRFEASCEKRGSSWKLRAKCFFCEFDRSFSLSYWMDHIRIHTGEYSRMCIDLFCGTNVMAQFHCGLPTEMAEVRHHNLATADLMCFICKHCNFVQLEQKNMDRHVIKQHGKDKEIEGHYDRIVLLPSKITINRETGKL